MKKSHTPCSRVREVGANPKVLLSAFSATGRPHVAYTHHPVVFRPPEVDLCLARSLGIQDSSDHSSASLVPLELSSRVTLLLPTQIVAGLTGIDVALRVRPFVGKHSRILEAVADAVDTSKTRQNLAPAPSIVFDLNRSNKRRVKKGSDPIHNRYKRRGCLLKDLKTDAKEQVSQMLSI
ncbi:hypothetical protein GQ457_11G025820 [Hibiscus cannabinus]